MFPAQQIIETKNVCCMELSAKTPRIFSFNDWMVFVIQAINSSPSMKWFLHWVCVYFKLIFSFQGVAGDSQTHVRMRRRLNTDTFYWHARYIGQPEPDLNCPTIVRKTIDSYMFSQGMMEFIKALGLRFVQILNFKQIFRIDYELLLDGCLFTKGNIRVIV